MQPRSPATDATVLELVVDNHAGPMSHVCGLFSRRAFSLEGILCLPFGDGNRARLWLRVVEDDRLAQLVAQLGKLEEVLSVHEVAGGHAIFDALASQHLAAGERLALDGAR